jgi:hypothetical protein
MVLAATGESMPRKRWNRWPPIPRLCPWALAALSGCAGGTLGDGLDAGATDALSSATDDPFRKPPAGSTDPAAGNGGGVDGPQGPPSAKPPAGACGDVDETGICKGSVAFWCDAGELRDQDCRAIGTTCEFLAESGGFRCSPLGGVDPGNGGGADPGNGNGADPGNGGGADPGNGGGDPEFPDDDPLPPDDDPGAPADPGGPAGDACGGIDYLGECQGDTAVWCDAGALQNVDCTMYGTPCGYVDAETGYYCLTPEGNAGGVADAGFSPPPSPEPDAFVPPPAGGGCDLGFLGECQGDFARYCVDDQLVEVDCAARGQLCDYISDVVGYYCMDVPVAAPVDECGGLDYLGECQGDTVVWCDAGQLYSLDCAAQGEFCGWISDDGGYFCTTL